MLKYIDEYRDPKLAQKLLDKILSLDIKSPLNFMEVCGTHTMSISRFGLRKSLSKKINLISGPGCPVCVTTTDYLDRAIAYSLSNEKIITTFGDMYRVPGSRSTLEIERSKGADIRIVYSPLDSIQIARENPNKQVVFLSVGFETTTPTVAGMILEAKKENIKNLSILCGNKTIPRALKVILEDKEVKVNGFLLPAHVSTMIGSKPYEFLAEKYNVPCVITGFEALDILAGVSMLIEQVKSRRPRIENEYKRFARLKGNPKAMSMAEEVFEPCDAGWRGFGTIEKSGLKLRESFRNYDMEHLEPVKIDKIDEPKGCLCGSVLKGVKKPFECRLFGKTCTPEKPVGACMVSSEGTCAAYYRYERI